MQGRVSRRIMISIGGLLLLVLFYQVLLAVAADEYSDFSTRHSSAMVEDGLRLGPWKVSYVRAIVFPMGGGQYGTDWETMETCFTHVQFNLLDGPNVSSVPDSIQQKEVVKVVYWYRMTFGWPLRLRRLERSPSVLLEFLGGLPLGIHTPEKTAIAP